MKTGATSSESPSKYWRSSVSLAGSPGNSRIIARIIGMPAWCASTAFEKRYGIRRHFRFVKRRSTSHASSS